MGDFSYDRVLDVRHVKCKGKIQTQYLIRWNPSYTTSAECGIDDADLMKDFSLIKVMGPADVPENDGVKDPKKMIWGVKRTHNDDRKEELDLIPYKDVRKMYVEELADYLMQYATV